MLTEIQRKIAHSLLICRPGVIQGTCAIRDRVEAMNWHEEVSEAMRANKIRSANDIKEFCYIAGVAD